MKRLIVGLLFVGSATTSYAGPTLDVKIIQRQSSTSEYGYVVPSVTTGSANANCQSGFGSANCFGTSTQVTTPAHDYSYQVSGATFTLLLPDGRRAVVNCVSKYAPRGDYINRRSCRVPLVDNIKAEFTGDNAKLKWPVSLDGKKFESETYKILAVLDK